MKKLFVLLLLPVAALSQKNYSELIDNYMQANFTAADFNGNVLVAKSGKLIYQKAFGYRNYNTKTLLDNNSVFELASVSKQFTAMGILILKEKGKLALTDTLRKFLPDLPYSGVTIQNLLTHTSGLPDYMAAMDSSWDHKIIAFNDAMIHFLASEKIPANFDHDKKWEYSNTAYAILASIIEKVSGLSYKDYMRKNIFEPLGMNHSQVYNTRRSTKDTIADYAYGFVYSDSLKRYITPDSLKADDFVIYLDGIVGDGTINSTTGDLLKWDRALKNHALLNEAAQNQMFSPQSVMDTINKVYYGYGVTVGKDQFGNFISHSGGWPGYATNLARYIAKDFTIIILSNNESNAYNIGYAVAGILFDAPVVLPYVHKEIIIDTNSLNRYTGSYHRDSTLRINIIKKVDKLYRHREGTTDVELKPESNTKFFYGDRTDRQIEFETDQNGHVTKFWLINCGLKTEFDKL
jgi:CubicO group peptidase (beta-lactamase class C family)